MKDNVYVKGTCPHCGAKIPSYAENKWLYYDFPEGIR